MIFRRISYVLAAQFTAFVFVLLVITGGVFFGIDVVQRRAETRMRLEQQLVTILNRPEGNLSIPDLPQFQRERIRITDRLGQTIYAGTLYDDIPFSSRREVVTIERGRESYDILTAPFAQDGEVIGYLQVADRSPPNDFEQRVFLFLLISFGISTITFAVGLYFAQRSLKPAEQMMERLEQFTQDASHELRTPLTAVSTSLDLALASSDNKEFLQSAKKSLKDVTTLTERLLDLARLDAFILHKEPVDFSALTKHIVDMHETVAKAAGVTIETKLAPNISVQADPTLLKEIVSNLFSNAIKFNTKNGTVTVTLTAHALIVQDTGKGISSEALPHIFDRFYREDTARSHAKDGLGLGLALTKRVVDLHGWNILVESAEGKGSTFTVRF